MGSAIQAEVRGRMVDWSVALGSALSSVITAVGAYLLHLKSSGATAEQAKNTTNTEWMKEILRDGADLRQKQGERIGILEHQIEEYSDKLGVLEGKLLQEQRTVDRVMTENENLRQVNENLRQDNAHLREDNAKLVDQLQEERASNRSWQQKVLGLETLVEELRGKQE